MQNTIVSLIVLMLNGWTVCFYKGNIWQVFLYLLAVSTAASWHKYVKRVATELPFMALKININT